MICPNEKTELIPVKAEAHYGQTVMLDQCPQCGGIWFDSFELYMAKQGQAEKIEHLDTKTLQAPSPIESPELHCPRDDTKLVRFLDPFFPKDLIIARCPACGGFWLNRGEFIKYQGYRESLKKEPKEIIIEDNQFERDIARIWAENKADDKTEALGKLAKFLSMPLDEATWRPLEPDKLSDKEKYAYNLIVTALNLILRFFIRI